MTIFILPPSMKELRARLERRAEDAPEVIAKRLENARNEIARWPMYDYVIVNEDIQRALHEVKAIILAERLKRTRSEAGICALRRRAAEGIRSGGHLPAFSASSALASATKPVDVDLLRARGLLDLRALQQRLRVDAKAFQRLPQHLAALAEGGLRDARERFASRRAGALRAA